MGRADPLMAESFSASALHQEHAGEGGGEGSPPPTPPLMSSVGPYASASWWPHAATGSGMAAHEMRAPAEQQHQHLQLPASASRAHYVGRIPGARASSASQLRGSMGTSAAPARRRGPPIKHPVMLEHHPAERGGAQGRGGSSGQAGGPNAEREQGGGASFVGSRFGYDIHPGAMLMMTGSATSLASYDLASPNMSNLRSARFSYFDGKLSPTQEYEAHELARHLAQRAEALAKMDTKRHNAQRRAVARKEPFWSDRHHAERKAEMVQRACTDALAQPIKFLPSLPPAAELAKRTWVREDIFPSAEEREEAKTAVEALSDDLGILSTVITAWGRPDMQKQWLGALKGKANDAKGVAPQARHFRAISVSEKAPQVNQKGWRAGGSGGASLRPYVQPPSEIPPYVRPTTRG